MGRKIANFLIYYATAVFCGGFLFGVAFIFSPPCYDGQCFWPIDAFFAGVTLSVLLAWPWMVVFASFLRIAQWLFRLGRRTVSWVFLGACLAPLLAWLSFLAMLNTFYGSSYWDAVLFMPSLYLYDSPVFSSLLLALIGGIAAKILRRINTVFL